MRFLRWVVSAVGAGAALLAFACAAEEQQHSVRCPEGPPQYSVTQFPPLRPVSGNAASLPECIPICGAQKVPATTLATAYPVEALPSGACEFDGDQCQILAGTTQTCDGVTRLCNNSGFECSCEGGNWKCYVTSPGAGVCPPCNAGDAAPPACTTAPPRYATQRFPPPRGGSADHASLPECPVRCGAQKITSAPYYPEYDIEDLPSGTCDQPAYRCRVTAGTTQTCEGTKQTCNQSEFECACGAGTWECFVTSQGGGGCVSCDGGP